MEHCKIFQTINSTQQSEQNSQLSKCFQKNFVIAISVQFIQDGIDDDVNTI